MRFIDSLFGGGGNPADAARPYLDQERHDYKSWLSRQAQAEPGEHDTLSGQFNQLINNPQALYDRLAAGFRHSPGYQQDYGDAMRAADSAAAAGGFLGTPQHQRQAASLADQLSSHDFNNYLDRLYGSYGQGLSGLGHLEDQDSAIRDQLAQLLGQNALSGANLAYQGQQYQNQQTGALGGLLGDLTGGIGGAFFNPVGSAAENWLGGKGKEFGHYLFGDEM